MSLELTEQGKLHMEEGASGSVDRSCCLGLTNVTRTSALTTSISSILLHMCGIYNNAYEGTMRTATNWKIF